MTFDSKEISKTDYSARRRVAARARQAEVLMQNGQIEEASNRLEEAVAINPANAKYLTQLATVRRGQGRVHEAIELATKALTFAKCDTSAHELLLQLYLETGQYEDLIINAKSIIKSSPRSMFARDMLGVAYLQMGMLDKALQMTSEMIHLDPMDAGNHFKKAVLFQQKGDLGKAIREFTRVVELEPDGSMADDAREAITSLDSFQLRQIIALAIEDRIFRAKLLRDAENASIEKGFFLSAGGIHTLKQVDYEGLGDLSTFPGEPQTYH